MITKTVINTDEACGHVSENIVNVSENSQGYKKFYDAEIQIKS